MVGKYIIDSCVYWANEYHVVGFRFDLMALIDLPTVRRLVREVREKAGQNILIYGEPWQAGGSVLPASEQTVKGSQKNENFAVFNDHIRGAIKGGSDDRTKGFVTGEKNCESGITSGIEGAIHDFTARAGESINYVTAHDNLNLWDKIAFSLGADLAKEPYSLIDEKIPLLENPAVRSVLLANGIVFTAQGIPFFQLGDEMLRTKFGDHNSYASPDSINMVRWENATRYREVIDYSAGLIKLRREHPAFRMDRAADIEKSLRVLSAAGNVVSFVLDGEASGDNWKTIFVAYNCSGDTVTLPLPGERMYQVVNPQNAGVETLSEISGGSVTLPPLSMAVLHL
jgi:pullulanase/glycogen debranching enzyme